MVITKTKSSGDGQELPPGEALTLITDVARTGVTRHQVEVFCARRSQKQPLVDYYRSVCAVRGH